MKITTFFDLCSGIGGGRLGLEQCGLKCVGYSDSARIAPKTYELMFDTSNEKNYGDLKKIDTSLLPHFDLLIAGFPCQTFSVIGRKDGFNDSRGQLIFNISQIIKETKPPCFILENVKGLVSHNKGETLKTILRTLDEAGYNTIYKVLSSINYGVPQMRQRIYFIGFRKDLKVNPNKFTWPSELPVPQLSGYLKCLHKVDPDYLDYINKYLQNDTNCGKYKLDDLLKTENTIFDIRMNDLRIYTNKCPTLRSQRDGLLYSHNNVLYQLSGYEALLLQGFPQSYADKVYNNVSDRHLLMQAGNAMTVNVIKEICNSIIKFLKEDSTMAWEEFEENCYKYLKERYSTFAQFAHKGKSDSTVPDIEVTTSIGNTFFVEAKQSPAQSGQFVLLPDISTQTFKYSAQNTILENEHSQRIREYMNRFFDTYKEAGTQGVQINFPNCEDVFFNWIIDKYQQSGVEFIITNDYKMIKLENIPKYFDVAATYRVKRSGSSDAGKKNIPKLKEIISENYSINGFEEEGTKLFVSSSSDLDNQRFYHNNYEFMLSKRNSLFEVRKLSNTFNANVIFSLTLKPNISSYENDDFEKFIK